MTPARYCRDITLGSRSSFGLSLRLLPARRRRGMYAIYAYCRLVDDVVDQGGDAGAARAALVRWRQEIEAAFAGRPDHPVARELAWTRDNFHLVPEPFLDLLDGMAMDLEGRDYETLADLEVYCHRVAVAVGRMALGILGPDPRIEPPESLRTLERFAHHLGMAFQLTNILRDVKEDGALGRIYLPRLLLREAGVPSRQVLAGEWSPGLGQVLARLGEEAEGHYRAALAAVHGPLRRRVRPALAMAAIYHTYLVKMRQRGFRILDQPIRLGPWSKLGICLGCWLGEKMGLESPFPSRAA
ncbi:MAG: presqualene diphosphate synthase HpnD [Magnetococcales bacterium]|nr:presqualene diphosphate synthase HpnD [Magnetococcales bacterium]